MIRWGKRSHRGTTEFCSAQCFSVIHICLQVQNSRAALGLAKALQWTLLSRAKHMLWSLSSSLPISSPCTVFYAIPYIFTIENEISPMNSMEQNVAILSCIENKWDGIPPPVLPATFVTVLFEAQFRPCWGVLSLSSCAEAYPFPSFDWWASLWSAIMQSLFSLPNCGLFYCHIWSDCMFWLCAFLIASFPCDQLHQQLDFPIFFFLTSKYYHFTGFSLVVKSILVWHLDIHFEFHLYASVAQ